MLKGKLTKHATDTETAEATAVALPIHVATTKAQIPTVRGITLTERRAPIVAA